MKRKDTIELTRVAFVGAAIVVFLIGLLLVIETGFDGELSLLALKAVEGLVHLDITGQLMLGVGLMVMIASMALLSEVAVSRGEATL
ncbi:MAG: hypothetical protein ISF22_05355 [Methanomassiliicoccus sp.]|nr:hypothetical protein [Methanomassiliicoccus sp.]